nr:serine-rich adhesin for platelets-like isoform X6 [Cherax quadricarinatus]XP_053653512.1 serine-rich adhesin for platelets-like isoform X6 [Cherax quadricarinatus]XP_053653513.1 serine-rich adhesin for platelets-like isoform X6 [Cherax quadricarinatus]
MSGGAKESHRGRRKRGEVSEAGSEGSEERSLTPPHHPDQRPPTVSPDQGVVTDDCWASAVTGDGAPLQFKIEEHVEEITTHRLTDDDDQDLDCAYDNDVSDSGGSWRGSRCSLDDSRETRHHKVSHHSVTEDPLLSTINVALPDPAHISDRRVSFPELGADIIHDFCSDVDCCDVGPGDMVLNSDTWEENWLFRRQRLMGASASDPVTMLIPNPEAHVPATVGNRDIDELSELSEQQSIGSGEPWSMSESDGEGECMKSCQPSTASRELSTLAGEIVAEFAQQDQEYTVDYSVPIRVTATCRAQQSRKHLASPQASPTHSHKSPEAQPSTRFIYTNHKGVLRNYHEGKTVEGVKNPGVAEKSQVDLDFVSDNERPVPKPRKLSLATKSSTNTSANSSVQLLLSPAEDLTILSPPLEVPDPSNTSSKSETVWFVETPEDCVVMQGRTLRLACQVNTKKPMGVSWYHNGSLVAVGGRDQWVYRQGPFYHLHVYGMTSVAAGLYATAAYTATNCVWAFCRVQYKANSRPQKRPTFTKGLSDVILEEGGDLYLQCQVQGHPEPRVIFSRGLERLEPSSRLAIESDQYGTWTLRLAECSASDSGEITATAASMLSAVNTHCRVKVVPEGTPIPQQVHTNSARLQPSALQTNKQQDPRPGGRHTHKKHNPGSHPPNTSRPTSDNLLISAKTSTPSHREKLTKSSGFNTDTDDLDDIHQVPTKPGTIAEREHRKWEAAVSIPNNPYAPERLVQRLSHTHISEHIPPPRRAISIEFPEESGQELDPSLRDGVPPTPDLNRYSRDYYVTSTTGRRTSSLNFRHQKSHHYHHHHQQQQQQQQTLVQQNNDNQQKEHRHQQEDQQILHKSEILFSANGHKVPRRTSPTLSTNVQEPLHIIGSGLQKNHKSNSEATLHQLRNTQVETSQPSDWKDELRDIQAARVEREVARFQRTINETQRRWEENYARHAPRSVHANGQSDSSTEVLHNPRVDAYLVPRRHDLWRTVSEDTIAVQPRDRTVLQPLLRHTSADNLQPSAKVSNLHNLGSVPLHNMSSMNSVGSMSNININSLTGLGKRTNYQHHSKFGRSVESVSTYSEGDSHGEGLDSDASIRTPEEVPALPSVRKLASKFDLASQERVNDLDKHGKANSLSFYGKKNIFMIEKSAPSDQPYSRSFINNLNKRTEKPYVVKEVRSLASGEGSRPSPETDMYESDVDSTEFDDEATVTSLSLPPTPGSLSDKHSLSNSSLIDTDSCFSTDCRDSNVTTSYDQSSNKTIFGVTLRKTTTNPYGSFDKRKQTSLSSISSVEEVQRASSRVSSHNNRHSWNTSTDDLEREVTPSDCDSDASNRKFYYGSMSDLSNEESVKLKDQKQFHSSFDLSSISRSLETEHCVGPLQVNTKGIKQRETIQQKNKQAGTASVCLLSGSAFAPKGKRRMSDFLNSYVGHKSIHDLNRIDEKTEEDTNNQRYRVAYKTQSHSVSDLPKEPLKKNDALKRSVREDTSKRSVREDTSKRSVSEDTSERSVSEDTSKRSVSEDTSERSVNEDASKRSVGEDTSKSEDTCKKSESEDTYTKPETEGSFKSIDKNASGQENNNDIQVRLKEPKNKTVSEVNGITQQPFLNYLEKAENSLQTSGQDTLDSFAFVSQESVDSSKAVNSSDSQSLELSQMSNADVWDGASFIHTSDDTNTGTLIKSTDNDQFKIDLNEAYISTFYNQLVVDNSQSLTKSTVDTLPVGDSPVTLSKGGKEETVISTTNVHPVQKRRSIGDFLKGYTNISSLDEKTTFNKVTIPKNANTETNLTLIAVSDSNVNMQPQDQSVPASRANVLVSRASVPASGANVPASRAGVPESRASVPASRAGVPASRANVPASRASVPSGASVQNVVMQNAKQSPISSKESTNMTNKNHNHNESTEPQHLGNEIQTPKNNHPDEKFSYTTDKCTVITLSGKEPSLSDASSSVYHANIIYVGDNMKNNHGKDTVQSSTLDKASKNTSDMDPVSMHTNISSIKDSVDVTARHSQSEHKFVSQSVQPVVAGKNPVVNDKKLDHSQDLLQVNDVRKDDDQSSTGPYVTVIAVSDLSDSSLPSYKANVTSSSENSSDDELLLDDPVALTRMIVHNSRIGNSNSKNLRGLKKIDLTKASVPANSPFSPLRSKSSSLICDSSVVDNVPQKKHVGPRDSCDEGVHSQLSDIEVASSGTSMESKSLGSLETCGEDGHDAMVQCS